MGVSLHVIRGVVLVVCIGGIAGMIIGTVATDNNNGVVMTFGVITAVSVLTLIVSTMAVRGSSLETREGPVDEAMAERVEARITSLVDAGADEATVRALVGDAVRLGRSGRA
jgi:hypothetical protein